MTVIIILFWVGVGIVIGIKSLMQHNKLVPKHNPKPKSQCHRIKLQNLPETKLVIKQVSKHSSKSKSKCISKPLSKIITKHISKPK